MSLSERIEKLNDSCSCLNERDFVKHIMWKDFEKAKAAVTKLLDSKSIFSPAEIISEVHFYLDYIIEFVRNYK